MIRIRELEKKDNPVIAEIIRTVMSEFNADPKTTIIGDPVLDTMFENYRHSRSVYYIAESDDVIAGGCGINKLSGAENNICELQRMFLLPHSRGKGIGKMLLDLCIRKAKEFVYDKVYIETLSEMHSAIGLYKHYGFRKISKPIGKTGHSGCNIYMLLELKDS